MITYQVLWCTIQKKRTAHKIKWNSELQELKVRYYPVFLCGICQRGLISTINAGNSQFYKLNK